MLPTPTVLSSIVFQQSFLSCSTLYLCLSYSGQSLFNNSLPESNTSQCNLKGCVRYIFASLFCMSNREHL